MASKFISDKLKQARLSKGLSQKDVYQSLNIKQSRFSAWETGKSEPDIRTFLELCRIYGVDSSIYNYFCSPNADYNNSQSAELARAIEMLREVYSDSDRFEAVLNCLEYEHGKYLSAKVVLHNFGQRELPVYLQPAAAGLGNYINDDVAETMLIPAPAEADAGIRISGDSMEPDICDGEIVCIKYQPSVEFGDVGIFVHGNDAYCKKLDLIDGRPCLVSFNKNYSPIFIDENWRTVGKVLL